MQTSGIALGERWGLQRGAGPRQIPLGCGHCSPLGLVPAAARPAPLCSGRSKGRRQVLSVEAAPLQPLSQGERAWDSESSGRAGQEGTARRSSRSCSSPGPCGRGERACRVRGW